MRKFVLILLLVFSANLRSEDVPSRGWRDLLNRADSLERAGDLDSAIVIARISMDLTTKEFGGEDTATARVLNRLGNYYDLQGKEVEAEQLFKKALEIREKHLVANDPSVAQSLNGLGFLYARQGRLVEAEALIKRSVSIRELTPGADSTDLGYSLETLATLYVHLQRYPEAEELYRRALAIREKHPGSDYETILGVVGQLFLYQGRYAEADSLFNKSLAITEQKYGADDVRVASYLHALAIVHMRQGRYSEGERIASRALAITEIAEGPNGPDVAEVCSLMAALNREIGRYDEAAVFARRTQSIMEQLAGTNDPRIAPALNGLANIDHAQGRYSQAEFLYKRVLTLIQQTSSQSRDVATVLGNLAALFVEQGRYDEADSLYGQVLSIHQQIPELDPAEKARNFNNVALLRFAQGRYAEAESLFMRSLKVFDSAYSTQHPDLAECADNLGDVYRSQGRYSDAEQMYQRALTILEAALGGDHPRLARNLQHLARLYCDQGLYAKAAPFLDRALQIANQFTGFERLRGAIVSSYGELYRRQDNYEKALNCFSAACIMEFKDFSDNAAVLSEPDALRYCRFMRGAVDRYLTCYLDAGSHSDTSVRTAANLIVLAKGRVTDGLSSRQRILVTETDSATVAALERLRTCKFQLSRLFSEGPTNHVASYRSQLDSLGVQVKEMETYLARRSLNFKREQSYQDISIEKIASVIPDSSAIVEYIKFGYYQVQPDTVIPRYLALVVDDSLSVKIIDLGFATRIDSLVQQYLEHFQMISSAGHILSAGDVQRYKRIAGELYGQIWKPLMPYVQDNHSVMIAPDGALNLISFAGLVDEEGQFLIEEYALHYLSAGRDIVRYSDTAISGTGLFALGDPDFDASPSDRMASSSDQPIDSASQNETYSDRGYRSGCEFLQKMDVNPLPGTRAEIENVSKIWMSSSHEPLEKLLGAAASEDRFKRDVSGHRVVHVATHGYFIDGQCQPQSMNREVSFDDKFVGENPLLLSGLLLAGANLRGAGADSIGAEDGILSALEISGIDFSGTDQVFLSACETGLGQVVTGEGVYGLRRAFLMSGARTVISSLWPVSDQATSDLMGRIYRNRGESLADVMREYAIREIERARKNGGIGNPNQWGAFIATGDWHVR